MRQDQQDAVPTQASGLKDRLIDVRRFLSSVDQLLHSQQYSLFALQADDVRLLTSAVEKLYAAGLRFGIEAGEAIGMQHMGLNVLAQLVSVHAMIQRAIDAVESGHVFRITASTLDAMTDAADELDAAAIRTARAQVQLRLSQIVRSDLPL